jgi:hypothetical protein
MPASQNIPNNPPPNKNVKAKNIAANFIKLLKVLNLPAIAARRTPHSNLKVIASHEESENNVIATAKTAPKSEEMATLFILQVFFVKSFVQYSRQKSIQKFSARASST